MRVPVPDARPSCAQGYEVHGIIRRSSSFNTGRVDHLYQDPHLPGTRMFMHYGDLQDATSLFEIVRRVQPSEVFALAAQSMVRVSFEIPEYTADVDGLGTLRLLNAIRAAGLEKTCRFYQASSSELYGLAREVPQSESTPFHPRSPYAIAKQFAFWTVVNHREAYGMHASNGILFNHESPRRGPTFVTRKVTRAVAAIHNGEQECIFLGNLGVRSRDARRVAERRCALTAVAAARASQDAKRDWGHAREYVEMMWRMLQQDAPDDYVIATGECHSVRELVEVAFRCIGVEVKWKGTGVDEVGVDAENEARILVRIDPRYFRPAEVDILQGDASKARRMLGWKPQISFEALIKEMVDADLAAHHPKVAGVGPQQPAAEAPGARALD